MENHRYLLISDLDGTLLGNDSALEEFSQWHRSQRHLLRLVYNSGRLLSSVRASIESTALPEPDAIIGGVGTQIQDYHSGRPIGNWLGDCDGWHPARICAILARYHELKMQPAEFLADHKISYYAKDAPPELLDELRRNLMAAGCHVKLVYSSNRDLDVLPQGADKGSASAFLAAHWSIAKDHVIVSGDSGNDLAMFQQGYRGIVVGNAHQELKLLNSDFIFQANRAHAAGVLQGLQHWLTSHIHDNQTPTDPLTATCR